MVTFWSLCFLALAASSGSSGHAEASAPPDRRHGTTGSPQLQTQSPPSTTEAPGLTPPPLSAQTQASERNDEPPEGSTTQRQTMETSSTAVSKSKADADGMSMVTMATGSTSKPVVEAEHHVTWGYVILFLILLVILVLSITLYSLRRASRTYSFDLQRAPPVSHPSEPTGTFEPVHLDLVDRPAPIDQLITDDLSPPPVANGNVPQSEEKDFTGENVCSSDPFVEINLSDLTWFHQLVPPS